MVGSKKMGGAGACQHVGIVVSVRIIGSQVLAEDGQKYQENNYDKTTGVFLVTVDDPYVFYSNKDSSKYSVSISDSSVAQVTGITPKSNDSFEVSVYFAKAGSADFIFKYGIDL